MVLLNLEWINYEPCALNIIKLMKNIQVQFSIVWHRTKRIAREGEQDWPSAVTVWDRCGFDICTSAFIISDWFSNIYRRYFVRQACPGGKINRGLGHFLFTIRKYLRNLAISFFLLNILKLFNLLNKNERFMNS